MARKKSIEVKGIKGLDKSEMKDIRGAWCAVEGDDWGVYCGGDFYIEIEVGIAATTLILEL